MTQRKSPGHRSSHPLEGPRRSASHKKARTVQDVMSPDLATCFPDARLVDVARLMVAHDCGEIPVLDPDTSRPVGVVTDRDIVCRLVAKGENPLELHARDCMSAPAVTVTPGMSLEECCQLFEEHKIRRAPVVDDGGRCCGMVAQADLARKAPKPLTAEMVRQVSQPGQPASGIGAS